MSVTDVINGFDLKHEMKNKLIKKGMIKFKESDYTNLQKRERAASQLALSNYRNDLKTTQRKLRGFQEPVGANAR